MAGAAGRVQPPVPLPALRSRMQVTSPSPQIISISGSGTTAAQAQTVANAVARSDIAYSPRRAAPTRWVAAGEPGGGDAAVVRLVVAGVLGALAGLLAGVVVALAVGRGDRRLRERDEIADAIGVPVLASVPVSGVLVTPRAGCGCWRTTSRRRCRRGDCGRRCIIWA